MKPIMFTHNSILVKFALDPLYFPRFPKKIAENINKKGLRQIFKFSIMIFSFFDLVSGPQGGFLIFSGICFNALVMAMMFRPISLHYKFMGIKG